MSTLAIGRTGMKVATSYDPTDHTLVEPDVVRWPAGKELTPGVVVGQPLEVEVWFVEGHPAEPHPYFPGRMVGGIPDEWKARVAIPNVYYRSTGGRGSPATTMGSGATQEAAEADLARKLVDRLVGFDHEIDRLRDQLDAYAQFVRPVASW